VEPCLGGCRFPRPGLLTRRAVLLAAAGLAARQAGAALPVPSAGTLAFRMVRHDSEIGRHTLTFERRGGALTVRVAVDALVTFLAIPIVRYRHRLVETWQGETLVGLVGETDKNGEHGWVNARRTSEGLVVRGSQTARYVAPENALDISYWNKRLMDGPMISTDDGLLVHPKVEMLGTEQDPPVGQLGEGVRVDPRLRGHGVLGDRLAVLSDVGEQAGLELGDDDGLGHSALCSWNSRSWASATDWAFRGLGWMHRSRPCSGQVATVVG